MLSFLCGQFPQIGSQDQEGSNLFLREAFVEIKMAAFLDDEAIEVLEAEEDEVQPLPFDARVIFGAEGTATEEGPEHVQARPRSESRLRGRYVFVT